MLQKFVRILRVFVNLTGLSERVRGTKIHTHIHMYIDINEFLLSVAKLSGYRGRE